MKKITALLLLLLSAQAGAATKVQEVSLTAAAGTSRLVLNLSASPTYKVFTLAHPERVVIDVRNARLTSPLPGNFSGSPIQSLRSGIRHGRDLRVVLDLSAPVALKSFVLQPSDNQGYRLVVDLKRTGGVVPAVAAPQAPPAAPYCPG